MSANRRGFLGMMAVSPVAIPAAAEAAAKAQLAGGMAPSFGGAVISGTMKYHENISRGVDSVERVMEPDEAVRKAFKLGLISREKLAEMLSGNRLVGGGGLTVYHLDPDLQASKSLSMTARFRIQRDRNRDREIEQFLAKPKSLWDYGRELAENTFFPEPRP